MLTRKKSRKKNKSKKSNNHLLTKTLVCRRCKSDRKKVGGEVISWMCARCVQQLVAPPEEPVKSSGRPRGWHFKKFFEFEGKVYSKGEEVTDIKKIKLLRKEFSTKSNKRKNDDNATP